jgi:23S rRNA pseudouridine1911/1915/1917 synthase
MKSERGDTIQFAADRGDSRLRLDQVLVRRVTGLTRMSRSTAQRWIESGAVTVDGAVARRPAARVREGGVVNIALPPDAVRRSAPAAEPAAIDVLYEDEALIAINKPAGVVIHPSYKQLSGTLLNAVLWRLRDRPDTCPGILTRLDKDTSGIVVIALSGRVHAAMQRDAAAGLIRKEYLAIVRGTPRPAAGVIREPLARDPADRRRVIVSAGGAYSETHYEVLQSSPPLSIVRCELVTGRTHQIRVHLASRGWPLIGDRVYGCAHETVTRQALHAWRLTMPHPDTRQLLVLEAPVPTDMRSQNFTL